MIVKYFDRRDLWLELMDFVLTYKIPFKVDFDHELIVVYFDIDKHTKGFKTIRDFRTGIRDEEVDYQITDDEVGLE